MKITVRERERGAETFGGLDVGTWFYDGAGDLSLKIVEFHGVNSMVFREDDVFAYSNLDDEDIQVVDVELLVDRAPE